MVGAICFIYLFTSATISIVLGGDLDIRDKKLVLISLISLCWPISLPVMLGWSVIKKLKSRFIFTREKFAQISPESSPVDILTIEQENEKLLDQYHANMVRISEMEFAEMKELG